MTAEIAIVNRSGIALAADSAVTVGRERVWKTSNKIFSLAPHNDIGFMIYGAGDFIGIPWETIIKVYREKVGSRKFSKVKDCVDDFYQFLCGEDLKRPQGEALSITFLFIEVMENIKEKLNYEKKMEFRNNLLRLITSQIEEWKDIDVLDGAPSIEDFRAEWGGIINTFAKEIFKESITQRLKNRIEELCYDFFSKEISSIYETGIVVAGFGHEEIFPVLYHSIVDGKSGGFVRVWRYKSLDLNDEKEATGQILPFAQDDIFFLFMEGIHKQYIRYISHEIFRILHQKNTDFINDYISGEDDRTVAARKFQRNDLSKIKDFIEKFNDHRQENLVGPVMEVVASLPREEMAAMAEALVEITSLRRKVDSNIESVSGPIDVAVISKGDGFVWIKRKHYFDIKYNSDFLSRRTMHNSGGGDDV